jgi:hypothetical protein
MKPFKVRLADTVDFFIYDYVEDSVWTNSDLSVILYEMPKEQDKQNFYRIDEAP